MCFDFGRFNGIGSGMDWEVWLVFCFLECSVFDGGLFL